MRAWSTAALVLVLGCTATEPCGPATCTPGCCLDGECMGGRAARACGLTGATCGVCSTIERCVNGACELNPRYDPDSGMLRCGCLTGCCDETGTCVPGNTADACGQPQNLCQRCADTERCNEGRCTNVSCPGCFDALGTCQAGDTDLACGTGGGFCVSCIAGQRCASNRCVEAPCNPASCPDGCCSALQRCLSPTHATCGTGGSSCVACATDKTCALGLCL